MNPEHYEIVKRGQNSIEQWRASHRNINFDLSGADLRGITLGGDSSRSLDLAGTNLDGATLDGANLSYLILTDSQLNGTHIDGATLTFVTLNNAQLDEATAEGCTVTHCHFRGGARLRKTILTGSTFEDCHFEGADFTGATLRNVILIGGSLDNVKFIDANMTGMQFRGKISTDNIRLSGAKHLHSTHGMQNLNLIKPGEVVFGIDECDVPRVGWFFWWSTLRGLGQLPLFGVSYVALFGIPFIIASIVATNEIIAAFAARLHQVNTSEPITGDFIEQIRIHVPSGMALGLVSALLIAVGSTIFAVLCPQRIKEFSEEQWCNQFGRARVQYRPHAWTRRNWRYACGITYYTGVAIALFVIAPKIVIAIYRALLYSDIWL